MPTHVHSVRNDRLKELVDAATQLGAKPIATAMTWPLAQIKRAARAALEAYDEAVIDIRDKYTEWQRDTDTGAVVKDANDNPLPAKVYARHDDGSPKFKLDSKGGQTAEREVEQGRVQLTSLVEYDREVRALNRQYSEIRVPHLQWPQLVGKLKEVESNFIEPLIDFFDNGPADEPETAGDSDA